MDNEFLTTGEAAKILNCSRVTIFHWIITGKIEAIRTPGRHFRIPKTSIDKFLKSLSSKTDVDKDAKKIKILVVDDEPHIVNTLVLFLKKASPVFDVCGTTNSFDAGILLMTFMPDIAIIDIVMPGIDGFEIVEKIKSDPKTKHIKVIAITGYGTKENVEKIKEKGTSLCVLKPFDYYEILQHVKKLSGIS